MKVQLKPSICEGWIKGDSRYNMKTRVQYDMRISYPGWEGGEHGAALDNPYTYDAYSAYFELVDLLDPQGLEITQENYPELYL